LRLAYHSFYWR